MAPSSESYLLANERDWASVRLQLLSKLFDPVTERILGRIGVEAGWKCWEIGMGNGSIAQSLTELVGSSGAVLATDIDLSVAPHLNATTLEIRRHDVVGDPLPQQQFNLIHARLVLVHLPERQKIIPRLVSCLSENGILFIEDADPSLQSMACPDAVDPLHDLANRVRDGFRALLAARGVDLAFGRTLPRILREHHLRDIEAEVYFPLSTGLPAILEALTIKLLRKELLDTNVASDAEIDALLSALETAELEICPAPLVSAWGRKSRKIL